MKLSKIVQDIKLRTVGRLQASRVSKTDFGIVKVAFMVAALDGDVSEAEFKALDALIKKCRGYSQKAAATVYVETVRAAGYLMLLSRRASDAEIVKAFLAEARAALPDGFAYLSIEEIRRAVVTWIAMGLSDGDYSSRERMCIEKLRKVFAELKIMKIDADSGRWLDVGPMITSAFGRNSAQTVRLITQDFVQRVERLVERYGDDAEAAKELEQLIRS